MKISTSFLWFLLVSTAFANVIEFITISREPNSKHQFTLTNEAHDLLSSSQAKIAVVSVIGKLGKGKSFLLNKVLDHPISSGFGVANGLESTTKGIWTTKTPICFNTQREVVPFPATRKDICYLFLDTEGLDDLDNLDGSLDQSLFTLLMMSSSVLIDNVQGKVDAQSLRSISVIHDLSEIFKTHDSYILERPKVLFAIQDTIFESDMKPLVYLLKTLEHHQNSRDKTLRETVRTLLDYDLDVFTFPPPIKDSSLWRKLPEIPTKNLDSVYLDVLENFKKSLFEAPAFKIQNQFASFFEYGNFLANILELFESVDIPSPVSLASAFEAHGKQMITESFNRKFNELLAMRQLPIDETVLEDYIKVSAHAARSQASHLVTADELEKNIEYLSFTLRSINAAKSSTICESLLITIKAQLDASFQANMTPKKVSQLLASMKANLSRTCAGPSKAPTISALEAYCKTNYFNKLVTEYKFDKKSLNLQFGGLLVFLVIYFYIIKHAPKLNSYAIWMSVLLFFARTSIIYFSLPHLLNNIDIFQKEAYRYEVVGELLSLKYFTVFLAIIFTFTFSISRCAAKKDAKYRKAEDYVAKKLSTPVTSHITDPLNLNINTSLIDEEPYL